MFVFVMCPTFYVLLNNENMCVCNSMIKYHLKVLHVLSYRNPTLAKCGGKAQHLEKLRIWSPPGLPNVQISTTRPKTPRIEAFLVLLEIS
jgi:hypothetical protein